MQKLRNNILIIVIASVTLFSCSNSNEYMLNKNGVITKGILKDGQKLGKWIQIVDSINLKTEMYYGYENSNDSTAIQKENIYLNDSIFLSLVYSNNWIKDIQIYNVNKMNKYYPFLFNKLGFELFHTNCGSCHLYFPNETKNQFAKKLLVKENLGFLSSFLHTQSILDSTTMIYHPAFINLDSTEIKTISDYVKNVKDATIVP